jgi:hypothetical protein
MIPRRADARGVTLAPGPNEVVRLDCSRALYGARIFVAADVAATVDVLLDANGPRSVDTSITLAAGAASTVWIPAPCGIVSVLATTSAPGRGTFSILTVEA